MFHESGRAPGPGFRGTSTPKQVADGVVSAIERDRGEVDVAPLSMRAGAMAAGLAPEVAAAVSRKFGGHRIADAHVVAHANKR